MRARFRRSEGGAYVSAVPGGYVTVMERDATEEPTRPGDGVEEIGTDDQEFSSVEDVGSAPNENPAVDDV